MLKNKDNNFVYRDEFGINKGYFNIYQAKNGGIRLQMGSCHTEITFQQILDLGIDVLALEDYDHDEFQEHYDLLEKVE